MHRRGPASPAAGAVVVHGRDQSPEWMFEHLLDRLPELPLAYVVPEADGQSWYPGRFMEPSEANEPWLSWTMERISRLVDALALPPERVALVGFSQGACSVLQYASDHPTRWGAIVGLTGGLVGPPGTSWDGPSLERTPVFLGTSDADEWVPLPRVQETAEAFRRRGAEVELAVYQGMGHEICEAEVAATARLLAVMATATVAPD
ncbi:MAG: putative hydrolase [Acidimicrobiales bacterium]|nr:putative hydrolase [Acidimicrobiales bacterium]